MNIDLKQKLFITFITYFSNRNNYFNIIVKKIKYNNINVNLNGVEINETLSPILSSISTDNAHASEDKYGTVLYGNGGSYSGHSGFDTDFKFICVNNNNNIVVAGEPEPPTCKKCFTTVLTEEELNIL